MDVLAIKTEPEAFSQSIVAPDIVAMNALPEEVLLRIFSYCQWEELKLLSLVNRRWYRVAGTSSLVSKVSLHLSKVNSFTEKDSNIDSCVLVGSERQYSAISCSLGFVEHKEVKSELGSNLIKCFHKWEIKRVSIVGEYDQVVKLFHEHGDLLASIEELSVILEQFSTLKHYNSDDQDRCTLCLGKLRSLSWVERSLPNHHKPQPHSFVFVVPQLQQMIIHRKNKQDNNLLLLNCTNLKKADINSYKLLSSSLFDSEYSALEQLTIAGSGNASLLLSKKSHLLSNLSSIDLTGCTREALKAVNLFARHLKVFKLSNIYFWPDDFAFGPTLEHLTEICLKSIRSMPFFGNDYLKCPHLTKLTALEVDFDVSLKLKAPHLSTLIVDQLALEYIILEDAGTVLNLGISRFYQRSFRHRFPQYSNVTHLSLNLAGSRISSFETALKNILHSYRHISKLTVAEALSVPIEYLIKVLSSSTSLECLHLDSIHAITTNSESCNPLLLSFLESTGLSETLPYALHDIRAKLNLQRLLITRSTTKVGSFWFAADVPWIRFYRTQFVDRDGTEYATPPFLEPFSPPLIRHQFRDESFKMKTCYSTRGFVFDESDEMLKW